MWPWPRCAAPGEASELTTAVTDGRRAQSDPRPRARSGQEDLDSPLPHARGDLGQGRRPALQPVVEHRSIPGEGEVMTGAVESARLGVDGQHAAEMREHT